MTLVAALAAALLALAESSLAGESFRDGAPRFLAEAGQVLDRQTGLTWQRCSVGQRWDQAWGCVGLAEKLGFEDAKGRESAGWRLPAPGELDSLYHAHRESIIDTAAFPDSPRAGFWTQGPDGAPAVRGMSCGADRDESCNRSSSGAVRLVRRGPLKTKYGK